MLVGESIVMLSNATYFCFIGGIGILLLSLYSLNLLYNKDYKPSNVHR